ncbi:helix-turn-helix domain-containing protein [Arthrobacter sp. AK01]|uniref:helix-turn-helix domain-containing protein n=1 Tax=Arthrobacter sp. AK01 TaxID=2894084 RepID=UPI001E4B0586|nr:helix-turn-helix transcriptional regulator [Arthrobacter sp. AK01]MCD4850092.1 helix-turn-helix domain-containing protein [Arthrobacter sp. AK01]
MRTPDELFGLEVQSQREYKGWSMTEFASMLKAAGLNNFHPTTVGRMERGERPVRLSEAVVIAEVLGSKLDDLVVEPLEADSAVRWSIKAVESSSKRAARYLDNVRFQREELEGELATLELALTAGKVLEEHIEQAQEACTQAKAILQTDRVKYWVDKINALTSEEQQALYSADQDFRA